MNSYLALLIGSYLALSSLPDNINETTTRETNQQWQLFKSEHGKIYDSEHIEALRKTVFVSNKNKVDQFNKHHADELGFSLKTNNMADLTHFEVASMNGFKLPNEVEARREKLRNSEDAQKFLDNILNDNSIAVPDELDWRKIPNRVSPVKNQGQCGSCWAFASVGALEGQEKVRKMNGSASDNIVELSEQNLVDCVTADAGCNGGIMKDAFEYIGSQNGIDDEQSYPYEGRTRQCRFRGDKVAFSDNGAAVLPSGDEQALKRTVAKFGPVAVAIDAGSIWFQLYHHGVYYNRRCKKGEDQLDHAVLVVGYGTDPKKGDYWLVKNSWGAKWGEKGYIRMARNKNNACGIATIATIPTFSN